MCAQTQMHVKDDDDHKAESRTYEVTFDLPPSTHARCPKLRLPVNATKACRNEGGLPVVVLLNGFQCKASYYNDIATVLASSGFLVLQYTLPFGKIVPDSHELPFLQQLLTWAEACHQDSTHFLAAAVDTSQLFVAGHSRGAKLAALHLSSNQSIRAAFLMDPVNNTAYTPESEEYPDACKALAACGRPVAVLGAGVIGGGNPEGSNWRQFFEAAAPGSCLAVVKEAGHAQFCRAGRFTQHLLGWLLGRGRIDQSRLLDITSSSMVCWFRGQLAATSQPAPSAAESSQAQLAAWFQSNCGKDEVEFKSKQTSCSQQVKADIVQPALAVG